MRGCALAQDCSVHHKGARQLSEPYRSGRPPMYVMMVIGAYIAFCDMENTTSVGVDIRLTPLATDY